MADLTQQEEQQLREAFANFDASSASAASTAQLEGLGGTKQLFCDNWPMVKRVLGFITSLPFVPAAVKAAIAMIIKAGDTIAGIICH